MGWDKIKIGVLLDSFFLWAIHCMYLYTQRIPYSVAGLNIARGGSLCKALLQSFILKQPYITYLHLPYFIFAHRVDNFL